ncbi:DUF423 domain-containing protein [Lichenibacterium ramalinae]|uniref:DUF423 domain-containing protein n=1 Tax=Lichenibacterium ramalinae TaxID=2316527 RepID=A0A4Q2RC47_9HYPH|nr:DUF423 domain-containing protein [Lichenibacterium ramalinae]RYB05022.1 DUF423 domain-containing protein [Lichenibacterium ramalinae]
MLDRPAPTESTAVSPAPKARLRWPLAFVAAAGLMGAAGVGIGAAAAHGGGNDLARTASEFLLLHAAAVVAASGMAVALGRTSSLLVAVLGLLTLGATLFGGELALAGLAAWRPLPLAAPTGGLCLMAGWLGLAVAALRAMRNAG